MMDRSDLSNWLRAIWWWRVSRHWRKDKMLMWIAWKVPRPIALWCFIRVYACTGDAPGEDYGRAYAAWEKGAGR